jgi:PAS domain S-box-containing protein
MKLSRFAGRLRSKEPRGDFVLETMLSSIGEGIVVYDRELRYQIWSPFMERLTGLSTAHVMGKRALEVFPHLVNQGVDELLHRALGGESVESADRPFRDPSSGAEWWLAGRYAPLRNPAGEIVGVVALIRDISERKRAEQALADSEHELAIHNSVAEVFLTVADEEMYERVLNIVLQALDSKHGVFGYIDTEGSLVCPSMTREIFEQCAMAGKSIVFPKDSWGGIWGTSLTTKKAVLSNSPGKVPDGHIAIGRCIFVPIVDREELIGLLAVANRETDYSEGDRELMESVARRIGPILHARLARDSQESERLRAEEALRESERRYRAVVEQQTELVERFDEDGTVTFVNDAMCRFFGVSRRYLIGTKFSPLMSDDDREATERHLASLSLVNPVGVNEVPCVAPDGSKRWLSWTNQALYDDEGNFVEFQAVGRDITEQRKAADNLLRTLAEKDALLKEVHHRVKNNMAVISSMISLQGKDFTDPEIADGMAKIQGRIRAMALVHDQLYHSGDFQKIDLGEYAGRLTDALFQTHPERVGKVDLQTRIADVAMTIDMAIPCGLILNELVSNSLEHAFPNEKRGEIVVSLDLCEDGRFELGVTDNGVGSREDAGADQGSGFGLQLVELLAKQLGGEVEIRWDHGADIRVRFAQE